MQDCTASEAATLALTARLQRGALVVWGERDVYCELMPSCGGVVMLAVTHHVLAVADGVLAVTQGRGTRRPNRCLVWVPQTRTRPARLHDNMMHCVCVLVCVMTA